jgi:hypothetical protein
LSTLRSASIIAFVLPSIPGCDMDKSRYLALAVAMLGFALAACVQLPTEKAGVVDLRRQVSFRFPAEDKALQSARVQVNGIDAGTVGEYVEGKAALRVLPGNNVIKVVDGSRVVYEQQVYFGDCVGRTILLK